MPLQTYNYHCRNKDCDSFAKNIEIIKDEEFEKNIENCDECNSVMYCVGWKSAIFSDFSLLNRQQKQQSLKKRSQNHYKKEIKDKQIEMDKKIVQNFHKR